MSKFQIVCFSLTAVVVIINIIVLFNFKTVGRYLTRTKNHYENETGIRRGDPAYLFLLGHMVQLRDGRVMGPVRTSTDPWAAFPGHKIYCDPTGQISWFGDGIASSQGQTPEDIMRVVD